MIDIIYRLCEAETDGNIRDIRPPWYNKLNCLKSFLSDIEHSYRLSLDHGRDDFLIDRLVFVLDGDGGPQFNLLNEWMERMYPDKSYRHPSKQLSIHMISARSNEGSYKEVLSIASGSSSDAIYLVEDDYLHLKGSIYNIARATMDMGMCTGYDHGNRYQPAEIGINTTDRTFMKEGVCFHQATGMHWRTAESTCLTFAFKQQIKDVVIAKAREHLLNDHAFWLSLLPVRLWTPIPGLTTQVDPFMSPGVDWEKFNNSIQ